jgi:site-specific recombinase XerD
MRGNEGVVSPTPQYNTMNLSNIAFFCSHDADGRLRSDISETTYQRVYRPAAARLMEFFEDIPVTDITRSDLKDWEAWLDSRDTRPATRNNYIRNCRAMWNHMKRRGVPVCDVSELFTFAKETKGVKSVSTANAWKMLAASGIRDTAIFWLAMDSARRRGGLANLTLDNFRIFWNEDIQEYYVIGEVVEKGNKPQVLLAYHEAAMALQCWITVRENLLKSLKVADHRFVFCNTRDGSPISLITMSKLAGKLAQRAGIPGGEPHSLHSFRHRRAKELLKDLDIATVRDILGHTTSKTTLDTYAVNGPAELADKFFANRR